MNEDLKTTLNHITVDDGLGGYILLLYILPWEAEIALLRKLNAAKLLTPKKLVTVKPRNKVTVSKGSNLWNLLAKEF